MAEMDNKKLAEAERQQELFQEFSSEPKKTDRFSSLSKSQKPILISANVEQILLAGILFVLFGCFLFFLGVLRGKAISAVSPKVTVAPVRPVPKPAAPTPAQRSAEAKTLVAATVPAPTRPVYVQAPPKQDVGRPYTIQLVTHKKKEFADNEVAALRRAGLYAWVIPSGDYHQVCVGQYLNKEDAKKDLKFFSAKHKDCFLRRR